MSSSLEEVPSSSAAHPTIIENAAIKESEETRTERSMNPTLQGRCLCDGGART
jgi:hypothetical protein